ncbi:peroxiredoxin [Kocuria flava]|uniref:Alkyl hydroperoxide reductase E n=1 Tax=Kocuria flava TaxID=446860 RepID=A0A0U3G6D1_9MICC|nr:MULTISPECIES: peroxiredoxin [Kocuria]ALU40378.1 peroxiredoxin [Kocuria flava]MCD1146489.1 peroxiredoxin [Kocuria sp. LUK]PLC12575.1 peroxiredoxin [Kocuria flava]GEO93784.1 peroxiredoxin [Kocuria flava]
MTEIGSPAPDFTLDNQYGEPVTLSALRGRPVALVFYPFAFSGVCTGELCQLQDSLSVFEDAGVRLLAVSTDSKYALRAFAREESFDFDLLSDFWPHGAVAQRYGVFDADSGMAERATFVLDAGGTVVDAFRSEPGTPRELASYRAALARLAG